MKDLSALRYTAVTLSQVEDIYGALLNSLKRDVDRARPGVVLSRLGRSEGYLRNVWHGRSSISLRRFLEVIEATGSTPARFFEKSFDTTPSAETFLLAMAGELVDRRLPDALNETLMAGIEGSQPARNRPGFDREEAVERLAQKSVAGQRRLLCRTQQYRDVEFLQLYLEYLDEMRFDHRQQAARLAETIALKVAPQAFGTPAQCTSLFCKALGILASAERISGHLAKAAAVIGVALAAARKRDLKQARARLLVCSSSVLRDNSQPNRAFLLLREAQEIYFDCDDMVALGQVSIARAILYCELGSYPEALRCYDRALMLLPSPNRTLRRWRMACHQGAALVHFRLNDFDQAELCLADARGESSGESHHNRAKLLRLEGRVAIRRGEHERAEHLLHRAWGLFSTRSDPRALLTQLDHLESLLLRGWIMESHKLANHVVASLLRKPELSSIKPLAIDLKRAVAQQRLTVTLIREAQDRAERLCSPSQYLSSFGI